MVTAAAALQKGTSSEGPKEPISFFSREAFQIKPSTIKHMSTSIELVTLKQAEDPEEVVKQNLSEAQSRDTTTLTACSSGTRRRSGRGSRGRAW